MGAFLLLIPIALGIVLALALRKSCSLLRAAAYISLLSLSIIVAEELMLSIHYLYIEVYNNMILSVMNPYMVAFLLLIVFCLFLLTLPSALLYIFGRLSYIFGWGRS